MRESDFNAQKDMTLPDKMLGTAEVFRVSRHSKVQLARLCCHGNPPTGIQALPGNTVLKAYSDNLSSQATQ